MSWFYEAIQRAQHESSQERATGGGGIGLDGDSILTDIEELAAFSQQIPSELPERREPTAAWAEGTPRPGDPPVAIAEALEPAAPPAPPAIESYPRLELPVRSDSRLVFQGDTLSVAAEQFRILRRKLTQTFSEGGIIVVTSPTQGDGKTLTSINLCSCLAEAGQSTLLVDTDLRRPTVSRTLSGPADAAGLADILKGSKTPTEAVRVVDGLRFHVALLASPQNDPSKLINGSRFREFLAWARRHFHWVVLDTSPVIPAADVVDLMPQADGILMVIRAESTPRELSKRAFDIVGKHLRGVIFNGVTVNANPDYRYLSGYYGARPK